MELGALMQHESRKAVLQEGQYSVPYHYLAKWDNLIAFPEKLAVAPAYLFYLKRVIQLSSIMDSSMTVLDAGCGDGRLIWELRENGCPAKLHGIDYSERAIQFASLFNPDVEFQVADLTKRSSLPSGPFDTVVSMETLEHIPPEHVRTVVSNLGNLLKPNGRLVLTVPHMNRPLDKKHYQHFDSRTLRHALSDTFGEIEFFGFYRQSVAKHIFSAIAGTYYFLYPLRRLGLRRAVDHFSDLGFRFFKRYLLECSPDEGNSLIAVCQKI